MPAKRALLRASVRSHPSGFEANVERELDYLEKLNLGCQIVCIVEYEGNIDSMVIADAFEELCDRYPVLRSRFRYGNGRVWVRVDSEDSAETVIRANRRRENFYNCIPFWDTRQRVARLILSGTSRQGKLCFLVEHAIVDGNAVVELVRELFAIYLAKVTSSPQSKRFLGRLPLGPDAIANKYFGVAACSAREDVAEWRRSSMFGASRPYRRMLRLSTAKTLKLISAAKTSGISMHGVLCGAIMAAQRERMAYPEASLPMECWTIINLRNQVAPKVSSVETSVLLAQQISTLHVAKEDTPISIGKQLVSSIQSDLQERRLLVNPLSLAPTSRYEKIVSEQWATACVSNLNVISDLPDVEKLSFKDFRIFQVGEAVVPFYGFSTYRSRMTVECYFPSHLYSVSDANSVVTGLSDQLSWVANQS